MSYGAACGATLLRSMTLVALAIPICYALVSCLQSSGGWSRRLGWTLLITPIVAPHLVTGYAYANFSLSLVHRPLWNELLYDVLVLVSIVPIGTTMLYFAPASPVSREALHCHRLAVDPFRRKGLFRGGHTYNAGKVPLGKRDPLSSLGFWARGPVSRIIPAACLMFLVLFQEFELASLMGIVSWTVWLFDAQAGGLVLSQSIRLALVPLFFETVFLGAACVWSWRSFGLSAHRGESHISVNPAIRCAGWTYLIFGALVFCLVPWTLVLPSALQGFPNMIASFTLTGDITVGCGFALAGGLLAYMIAASLVSRQANSRARSQRELTSLCISVPGLLGSLVLGLSLVCVFQLPVLYVMYDTSLPWLAGLILFLFPRAVILLLLWSAASLRESQHVAGLLLDSPRTRQQHHARELIWQTGWARHFWALVLLCYWAYVDLTAASILAPSGIVSAPVRLYNLMHYGQSAVLSAMVLASFGIPALLVVSLTVFRRPLLRVLV